MNLFSKVKSKNGQIADILVFFIYIVFVVYFIMLFSSMQLYFATQKIVDNVVRDEVEIIRTKGIFTESEYKSFLAKIGKYGSFNVNVFAEKQDNAGQRGKWFDIKSIKDKPFRVGDFIQIMVESSKPPLFSTILNTNFLFSSNRKSGSNFRMQSLASGMICSDGFIRGIEVINLINKNPGITLKLKTLDYPSPIPVNPTYEQRFPSKQVDNFVTITSPYNSSTPERTVNAWIDYNGRYQLDVVPNNDYAITEMYFTELLPY